MTPDLSPLAGGLTMGWGIAGIILSAHYRKPMINIEIAVLWVIVSLGFWFHR